MKKLLLLSLFFLNIFVYSFSRDFWGAIYVDEKTGIAGTVYDAATEREATRLAMQTCKQKSKKKYCEPILSWRNGCGAAAWSFSQKSARAGIGETSTVQAESAALKTCKFREGDINCKIVASACTNWETWETTTTTTWW